MLGENTKHGLELVHYPGFCHFFEPKKVTKKGLAVEKSNHFDTPAAAQKKLAATLVRACGPLDSRGSNSFLLLPPPGYQNGDFSKAVCQVA